MRKIKLYSILCLLLLLFGCDTYKDEIRYLVGEANSISEQLDAFEQSISAMRQIVQAVQNNDYITNVVKTSDGYKFTFNEHGTVNILVGKDGVDGKDGIDGNDGKNAKTPVLGVKQYYDGEWYWTLDDEWLYDSSFKMVRVNGKNNQETIKLKIEGEYWYISYDGGKNWTRSGLAVSNQNTLFKSVDNSSDEVLSITLKNGIVIQIPKGDKFYISLSYPTNISSGETITIGYYTSQASSDTEIITIEPDGWKCNITKNSNNSGTISATAPDPLTLGSIIVFASDRGRTAMATCDFMEPAMDLSQNGTANSYIISSPGRYSINVGIKGCGPELIDNNIASAYVLWEKIGTSTVSYGTTLVSDLILDYTNDSYKLSFNVKEPFKDGNAIVAVTDPYGKILWSWHLWFTKYDPVATNIKLKGSNEIIMDRNLGATSISKGSSNTLGMLYQWGRKDPFPSSDLSHTDYMTNKVYTHVVTDKQTGTVNYSIANPQTFLRGTDAHPDWLQEEVSHPLWTDKSKTIYDPCPPGWQITSSATWNGYPSSISSMVESGYYGFTLSTTYSSPASWFPFAGKIDHLSGKLERTGYEGYIWTGDSQGSNSRALSYTSTSLKISATPNRAEGMSVRCRRSTVSSSPTGNYSDLSERGTANTYIVPSAGTYRFKATTKGNSNIAFKGTPVSASVIWESYGTTEKPKVGSLISEVSYSKGEVQFKVPEPYKRGNAVIAVKDSRGTILWSWQIWLSDFNPESSMSMIGSTYVMDRNLGATESTPGTVGSLGTLYAYGRKDPFPSYSSTINNTVTETTTTFSEVYEDMIYSEEYIIQNPTVFISSSLSNIDSKVRWDTDKNEYDPCPPGWKVSDQNLCSHVTMDSKNHGSWILPPYSSEKIFFPSTGSNNRYVGLYGEYFYTTNNRNNTKTSYFFRNNGDGGYGTSAIRKGSVRCVLDADSQKYGYITDLSKKEKANSYIVSAPGSYKFEAIYKGNSTEYINSRYSVVVLWESAGAGKTVSTGDIVRNVTYKNNYIYFSTPETIVPGNAVIAVTNGNGRVCWSWHIWVTGDDVEAKGQKYANTSGTMMDRNLGALSNAQGSLDAQGMLYQWGRKDPFLPSASNSIAQEATSTLNWPSSVQSSSSTGTEQYASYYPTTFIRNSSEEKGWLYKTSEEIGWSKEKSMNDPCPPGWKVAPGGPRASIWKHAGMEGSSSYSAASHGILFPAKQTGSSSWYPATGRKDATGTLCDVGDKGYYWSSTSNGEQAYAFTFTSSGKITSDFMMGKANAASIRCLKDDGNYFVAIDSIVFSSNELNIEVGKTITLYPTIYPSEATEKTITWSSSNASIASVNSNGTLQAKAIGECTITATAGGINGSFTCKVVRVGTNTGLSGIPFMFNFNAKNINTKTNTIPRDKDASWNEDLKLNGNGYSVHGNYITIDRGTYATYDFGSVSKNPFNREGKQPLTIIAKVKGNNSDAYSIFSCRGNDYNYMFREDGSDLKHFYFHTEYSYASELYVNTLPNIVSVRVTDKGRLWIESSSDKVKSSENEVHWGNKSQGIGFFVGDIWGSEEWSGDFYWIFLSLNKLNDEQIRKVIQYNEF